METYIHNIQLSSDDEFSKRFNYVSWLWFEIKDGNPNGYSASYAKPINEERYLQYINNQNKK